MDTDVSVASPPPVVAQKHLAAFVGTFVFGVVVGAGALFFSLPGIANTNFGRTFFAAFPVVSHPQWPDVVTAVSSTTPPEGGVVSNSDPLKQPVSPGASGVSKEYVTALNASVKASDDLQTENVQQLAPLLNAINQQSLAGNYSGIFAEIAQANTILAHEKTLVADLEAGLSALSAAAGTTKNAVVQTSTAPFIAAGSNLVVTAREYFATLSQVLSGTVPSQTLITDLSAKIMAVGAAAGNFKQSFVTLNRILDTQSASSTTAH